VDAATLEGMLIIPLVAQCVVVFAHGSGSSRHSPWNTFVAQILRRAGLGTLLLDLLTKEEDASHEARFDIRLLAQRLAATTQWLQTHPGAHHLNLGYFGASTGAAAAQQAAAALRPLVGAIASRGGRPDLAGNALEQVCAATLLIVGGRDAVVIDLNQRAYERLNAEKQLVIIPGATHLFEEPGALEEVARLAKQWFRRHLLPQPT
jgi:pimeloyl-ACP methyl ester carboxylesterase